MIDEKKLREAFSQLKADVSLHDNKINVLSDNVARLMKEVDGYKTLLIDLRGEKAVDLHGSTGAGWEETAKEMLGNPKEE